MCHVPTLDYASSFCCCGQRCGPRGMLQGKQELHLSLESWSYDPTSILAQWGTSTKWGTSPFSLIPTNLFLLPASWLSGWCIKPFCNSGSPYFNKVVTFLLKTTLESLLQLQILQCLHKVPKLDYSKPSVVTSCLTKPIQDTIDLEVSHLRHYIYLQTVRAQSRIWVSCCVLLDNSSLLFSWLYTRCFAPPCKCYFAESVHYIAICVFCVLLSGCSSSMLEM